MELDDLIANPHAFGMPTFDEFCKNRDHYLKNWKLNDDAVFESADSGSISLKRETKEHWYYWGMHKSKNLYDIVRMVKDEGFTPDDVTFDVFTERGTAGKYIFHVKYSLKRTAHGRQEGGTEAPDSEAK